MNRRFYLIYYTTKNDSDLREIIKGLGAWFKFDESSWIINSNLTIEQVNSRIQPYVDRNKERLMILHITIQSERGWHKQEVWDWINEQRNRVI